MGYRSGYGPATPYPGCGRAICRAGTGRIMRHNLPAVEPSQGPPSRWQPGYPSIATPGARCEWSGKIG